MCEYITIIQPNGHKNKVRQLSVERGLNDESMIVNSLVAIVEYPNMKDTTLLNVGLYILEMTLELEIFLKLSPSSRHHEPICYHNKLGINNLEKPVDSIRPIERSRTEHDGQNKTQFTPIAPLEYPSQKGTTPRRLFESELQCIDKDKTVSEQTER